MLKILLLILGLLPFGLYAQILNNGTTINITKTWSQEPAGHTYPMAISVPVDIYRCLWQRKYHFTSHHR